MLRDRLVHQFLQETTLTYQQALDMALGAEAAVKDAKRLQARGEKQLGEFEDHPETRLETDPHCQN